MTGITVRQGSVVVSWQGGTPPYQLLCRTNVAHDWMKLGPVTSATSVTNETGSGPGCFYMVTSDLTPPTVPSGLQVTTNDCSTVTVRWNAAFDNFGGSGVRTYTVYRNGTMLRQVSAISNSIVDAGLDTFSTYSYSVAATDTVGNQSSPSSAVAVSIPPCQNLSPVAVAGPDRRVNVGNAIQFNGSGSWDPDGRIIAYSWNFGDGNRASGPMASHTYAGPGVYVATLEVTDNGFATSTDTVVITLNQNPVAQAGPDQSANAGVPLSFSATGSYDPDGTIATYAWDFGDGTTGAGITPTHAYASSGQYTATLTVTDDNGATSSDIALITVTPATVSSVRAEAGPSQMGRIGVPLSFSAAGSRSPGRRVTGYSWDFGDGRTATGLVVSNTFMAAGEYFVTLVVTDDAGGRATASTRATIVSPTENQPPSANTAPTATGAAGSAILFDASGSIDPDGSISSYSWDFGDGATGAGLATVYRYPAGGTFVARLTVRDSSGVSGVWHKTVSVSGNNAPQAYAGPDQIHPLGSETVFSASGSVDDGAITGYAWDFGDGTTGTGANPTHLYASPGTYTVRLTVTDNQGLTGSDTALVTIQAATGNILPRPDAGPAQSIGAGLMIQFDGRRSVDLDGSIVSYQWNFGDGATGSGPVVHHSYSTVGTRTVWLVVTDNAGGRASNSTSVTVTAAPAPGQFVSAMSLGGVGSDSGHAVAFDRLGYAYYGGIVDGRPVLRKRSPSGGVVWNLSFGGGGGSGTVRGIAFDAAGNVFVTGSIYGTLDFGGGPLTSAGGLDIFLVKLTPDGSHLWSKRFGSTIGGAFSLESGYGVAVDTNDNSVAITGVFEGPADFGGGTFVCSSWQNMFLAKYDAHGSHLWSKRVGGANAALGNAVAIDSRGNIFVTGGFGTTADFGSGPITAAGTSDMFLAKYSSSGGLQWVKTAGSSVSSSVMEGTSLALDPVGDVFVAGRFEHSASVAGQGVVSSGYSDVFIAKFASTSGNGLWAKRFGGVSVDVGAGIAVDRSGNPTMTGSMRSAVDFGAGPLTVGPGQNAFVVSLTGNGDYRWAKGFGAGYEEGRAVAVSPSGRVCVTGRFAYTVDFGGGPLTSAGAWDLFLVEFGQ